MTERPTLSLIAQRCGANKSTVSRVLNNRCDGSFSVQPQLRDKILRVAKQLNYRPNLAAQTLARRQTRLVAIPRLIPSADDEHVPGIYDALTAHLLGYLREHGFEVCTTYYDPYHDGASILPPWAVDGMVIMHRAPVQMIEELEQVGMPYVCVNCLPGPTGGSIQVDDQSGANLAMQHLLDLGHRRIAYRRHRTHLPPLHSSVIQRHEGYLAFLKSHGLKPIKPHDGPWDESEVYLKKIIKAGATAVLAYDHIEAIRLLKAALQIDVRFPDDLSLVCFNNEFSCSLVTPALTAVALPIAAMGRQAGERMVQMLSDQIQEQPPMQQVMHETLVVRQSTMPCPK
jgi:DNA-binding LacI/PurR family transcriptional regulator